MSLLQWTVDSAIQARRTLATRTGNKIWKWEKSMKIAVNFRNPFGGFYPFHIMSFYIWLAYPSTSRSREKGFASDVGWSLGRWGRRPPDRFARISILWFLPYIFDIVVASVLRLDKTSDQSCTVPVQWWWRVEGTILHLDVPLAWFAILLWKSNYSRKSLQTFLKPAVVWFAL